jgi:serine/threonine protein kinase
VYIAASICRGLHHAHEHRDAEGKRVGIVHRDVSPQNVLLTLGGEVKIGDFGIAKTDARASNPTSRVIRGKYAYMSPEQAQARPVDPRSDVFSAGVVLWELLVGERLFRAADVRALLRDVCEARVPRPSERRRELPEALDAIVLRATRRNPDERYSDARSMADALDGFLRDRGFQAGPTRIRELVQRVEPFVTGATSPWASLPRTRDRIVTRAAPSAATLPDPPRRHPVEDGAVTLVGWRPEPAHRTVTWLACAALGALLVAAVAWWLFGA